MIPERKYSVVIVAGGKGSRAGMELPKQFHPIGEEPMLMHTLRAFHAYDERLRIVVVLSDDHRVFWEELCKKHRFVIPHVIVSGGETRFHSVQNGLQEIPDEDTVGIHDGARPLVTPELIGRCFDASFQQGVGVVPVVDEVNSVRLLTETGSKIIDRKQLKVVQTPQVFPAKAIKEAYNTDFDPLFTDDASVAEQHGVPIILVPGEETNMKVTTSFDLIVAEQYMFSLSKR